MPLLVPLENDIHVFGTKRFTVNKAALLKANIGSVDEGFNKYFLGKMERHIPDAKFSIHFLERNSLDLNVREELGPERREIKLKHFFNFINRESAGARGFLSRDYSIAAYICDKKGSLRSLSISWAAYGPYWRIYTASLEETYYRFMGNRFISLDH